MLGKLIKYETKATGRIFLPLFIALLIFAGITRLIAPLGPEKFDTPAMISLIVYIIIMAGMFVMTLIMTIQRFYKNLLTDEGYLMLTLPVKPWQHIISKLLVSMMWMVANGIAALISIMIVSLRSGDFSKIVWGIMDGFNKVYGQLGAQFFLLSFEMIVVALISLASGILLVYASIALGHLVTQHKMLATFGAFIALSTLSQILFTLSSMTPMATHFANIHISSNSFMGVQQAMQLATVLGIIFNLILCAAYFFITNTILCKRLNLE